MQVTLSDTAFGLAKLLSGALLYPEIHYTVIPRISQYFRREPEIIADMPSRIAPGKCLPIMLLVKDADKYPIKLEHLRIISSMPQSVLLDEDLNIDVTEPSWYRIIQIDQLPAVDTLQITVEIQGVVSG